MLKLLLIDNAPLRNMISHLIKYSGDFTLELASKHHSFNWRTSYYPYTRDEIKVFISVLRSEGITYSITTQPNRAIASMRELSLTIKRINATL